MTAPVSVRALEVADTELVRALLAANGWGPRVNHDGEFATLMANSPVKLVAKADGEVVGFLRALSDGVSNGYISMLVVAERHRGRGIGRALVQACIGDDPRMTWVLRAGREGVAGFYEKLGFTRSAVAMERKRER